MNRESVDYFHTHYKLPFSVKTWGQKDVDGKTPFRYAIESAGTRSVVKFMEWILEKHCKNNDERLKLIYQYDNEGKNLLDTVYGVKLNFIRQFLKTTLKSIKNSKLDLDKLVPLYLYAIKGSNLILAKWTLDLLKNKADRKKLVNCRNECGLSSIFAAIKSGSVKTLNFVLNQEEFTENILFNTVCFPVPECAVMFKLFMFSVKI